MPDNEWMDRLIASIDAMDENKFCEFIAEDGEFRYGSQPAVVGRDAVREYVKAFFSGFKGLSHDVHESRVLDDGNTVFMIGEVSYTRLDDSIVTIPFLNKLKMDGDLVKEYHVYADPTPVFAPAE